MPELPEVEVLRAQLESVLVGAVVEAVEYNHQRYYLGDLANRVVVAVSRRGKFLRLELDDHSAVVLHLGMTGQLRWGDQPGDHVHLRICTDRGTLAFRDPRRFGSARLIAAGSVPSGLYGKLGQEPLAKRFDTERAVAVLQASDAPIKARLLSQQAIAGVGNYIADESLHRAGIHPARRKLDEDEVSNLVKVVRTVIRESVRHGGVSERDYMHIDGGRGAYKARLRCYGRAGYPCRGCRSTLKRVVVAGRGGTFCEVCQPVRGS
jgi:formamidopyrimidine-DNA glycosylase